MNFKKKKLLFYIADSSSNSVLILPDTAAFGQQGVQPGISDERVLKNNDNEGKSFMYKLKEFLFQGVPISFRMLSIEMCSS